MSSLDIAPDKSLSSTVQLLTRSQNRKLAAEVSATIDAKLLVVQQFNLKCLHCRLDASVPPQQRAKVYTRSKLDKHLRSHFHDRREQIKRLFRLDKNDVGTFKCPCCSADHPKYWREEECLAHMEAEHKVAME